MMGCSRAKCPQSRGKNPTPQPYPPWSLCWMEPVLDGSSPGWIWSWLSLVSMFQKIGGDEEADINN